MSGEEFFIKHSTPRGLNHALSLSMGIVIHQEMTESCSKQGVSHKLEFGERKQEDKNFEKTMLPEEQESAQER